MAAGWIERTILDKPRSLRQRYRTTAAGQDMLGKGHAMPDHIGITTTAVERQMALVKRRGIIGRGGPAKGDHWEAIE